MNVGADNNADFTFSGQGRLFVPFWERSALQFQGEYMYYRDRQEGQFDFGLVNRFARRGQAGAFGSFKYVSLSERAKSNGLFNDMRLQTVSILSRLGSTPGIRTRRRSEHADRQRVAGAGVRHGGLSVRPRPRWRIRLDGLPRTNRRDRPDGAVAVPVQRVLPASGQPGGRQHDDRAVWPFLPRSQHRLSERPGRHQPCRRVGPLRLSRFTTISP